ncbi:MAG: NAD(P)/FAD-dependent oxidoreductase [Lonepinella koalarum]|nr:NAD(P)/FAD-dependent oxidoreductase [Lonepinella koalarum]
MNKNIVVVGGGAGGLELVTYLGNKLGNQAKVSLIDRNPTHLWKPLLHEVATGILDIGTDAVSYRAQAHQNNFHFEQGTITRIDRTNKYIELAPIYSQEGIPIVVARRLPYDYLVLAIGSKSNDFNTKGVAEHCIFLDSSDQALRFQHNMLSLFLRFSENFNLSEIGEESQQQPLVEEGKVNIAIVGGGATGVELAAELYSATQYLSLYGYGHIDTDCLQVTLIEASSSLLPALPQKVSQAVHRELSELGVNVKLNTMVVEATANGFVTKDGEYIAADLMVWSAGVRASSVTRQFDGLELNRINQIHIKETLQTTVDDCIFAIGDCAFLLQENGKPVPPRAQSAHQMARVCGKNIVALFQQKTLRHFKYNDKGSLVSLANFSTVGSLFNNTLTVEGKLARLAYISLYRLHQHALFGCVKTGLLILIGRINRFLKPKMKLH